MINISGFSKRYGSIRVAHDDVWLTHKVTLLIGGNGSGKTTLLKAMAGLIHFDGVIQTPKQPFYVEENARFPEDMTLDAYLNGLLKIGQGDHELKDQLVEEFKLTDKKTEVFSSLSKGMKQKVNLIQALMERRAVYLLDEPFSGLDKDARTQLVELIEHHVAMFVCATHQVKEFDQIDHHKVFL